MAFTLTGDTLTQAAITAANKSHMPYSPLTERRGAGDVKMAVFSAGSYAGRNAAFNPTLPRCKALNLLSLNGCRLCGYSARDSGGKKAMRH